MSFLRFHKYSHHFICIFSDKWVTMLLSQKMFPMVLLASMSWVLYGKCERHLMNKNLPMTETKLWEVWFIMIWKTCRRISWTCHDFQMIVNHIEFWTNELTDCRKYFQFVILKGIFDTFPISLKCPALRWTLFPVMALHRTEGNPLHDKISFISSRIYNK